jgi:hypothetical protein
MNPVLALLIDCCRERLGLIGADDLRQRLRGAPGEQLAKLAQAHDVAGLVWRSLREAEVVLPGTAALGRDARKQAEDNIRLAAESGRLHRQFAASSLPHLFAGGAALAMLAWRDPLLGSGPVRLLVGDGAVGKAAALLGALGYVQEEPDPSVDPTDWHRRERRSRWRSDDGVLLDLDSRLADNRQVLAPVTAATSPTPVDVGGGVVLPTLPLPLSLQALAVEGCAAAWPQLRSLTDFAALVRQMPAPALAQTAERAARLGAERSLAAALVLSHRTLGTAVPEDLWFDGGAARLVRIGVAELSGERRGGSALSRVRSQALLVPGSRFFLRDLLRQLGSRLTR